MSSCSDTDGSGVAAREEGYEKELMLACDTLGDVIHESLEDFGRRRWGSSLIAVGVVAVLSSDCLYGEGIRGTGGISSPPAVPNQNEDFGASDGLDAIRRSRIEPFVEGRGECQVENDHDEIAESLFDPPSEVIHELPSFNASTSSVAKEPLGLRSAGTS